jgi:hypothetical protein
MGTFRTWKDVRTFYEQRYTLDPSKLKIVRIYQCPAPEELRKLFNVEGEPRYGVDASGVPAGAETFNFDDPLAKVYVFAEQTAHSSSCLYAIQVHAIVEKQAIGDKRSKGYFKV